MTTRLLFIAVLSMLGGSAVADIFLLGDVTPVFYLAPEVSLPHEDIPSHVVEGNQDLFLRFANTKKQQPTRVLFRSGDRFADYAVLELQAFYTGRNIGFEEVVSFSSDTLADVDLLILGEPDWVWQHSEITSIADLLSRGGNLLVVVELHRCEPTKSIGCEEPWEESSSDLLKALGSPMRVGTEARCCGGWGLFADHPFMRGIGPFRYGATNTVVGGTELIYHADGQSMLSVDEFYPSRASSLE